MVWDRWGLILIHWRRPAGLTTPNTVLYKNSLVTELPHRSASLVNISISIRLIFHSLYTISYSPRAYNWQSMTGNKTKATACKLGPFPQTINLIFHMYTLDWRNNSTNKCAWERGQCLDWECFNRYIVSTASAVVVSASKEKTGGRNPSNLVINNALL